MEIKQIMYILTLADEGNMIRAAEKLNISQPALSQTLRQIQEELGLRLFVKIGRSLELTEDGRFFYVKGNELVEKAEEFYYLMDRRRNQNQTHLRYYTEFMNGTDGTIKIFQHFFPDISFERSYCSSWQAQRKLKYGELDLMLSLDHIEDPDKDLMSEKLLEESIYAIVNNKNQYSNDKVIPVALLDGETLVLHPNTEALVEYFTSIFTKAGAHIGNIYETHEPYEYLEENGGFMFLPESTYKSFVRSKKLGNLVGLKLQDTFCKKKLYLTYRESSEKDTLPHAFFSFLRSYYRLCAKESLLPDIDRFTPEDGCILKLK